MTEAAFRAQRKQPFSAAYMKPQPRTVGVVPLVKTNLRDAEGDWFCTDNCATGNTSRICRSRIAHVNSANSDGVVAIERKVIGNVACSVKSSAIHPYNRASYLSIHKVK